MRVLFVDDEPKVLNSLRSLLWDLTLPFPTDFEFAETGEAAIGMLEGEDIDVLVTDMRMPGMGGDELIDVVRHRWPHVVRLVLSGHTEPEVAWGVLPWVQDFLSKPCEIDDLTQALHAAHESIEHRTTHDLVLLRELPARPDLLLRCQAVVDSGGDAHDIAAVVESDVVASANLLHIANSAFFGFPTSATTPAEAVLRLGTDAVLAIVTRLCAEQLYEGIDRELLERMNQKAIDIATAVRAKMGDDAVAFTSALLHDIGVLVLLARGNQRYARLHRASLNDWTDLRHEERLLFGVAHDEVGAHLLDLWQFDPLVVEVVSGHHTPEQLEGWPHAVAAAIHEAEKERGAEVTLS